MLRAIKVQDGPAPRRAPRGRLGRLVLTMRRGSWTVVSHAEARSIARVVRQLGGAATRYATNDAQSCVKVIEAPWCAKKGQ